MGLFCVMAVTRWGWGVMLRGRGWCLFAGCRGFACLAAWSFEPPPLFKQRVGPGVPCGAAFVEGYEGCVHERLVDHLDVLL